MSRNKGQLCPQIPHLQFQWAIKGPTRGKSFMAEACPRPLLFPVFLWGRGVQECLACGSFVLQELPRVGKGNLGKSPSLPFQGHRNMKAMERNLIPMTGIS